MFTQREIRNVLVELLDGDDMEADQTLLQMQKDGHIERFQTFNKNGFLDKIVVFMDGLRITLEKNV